MEYRDLTDEEIIALCRQGDMEAAQYLMQKYKPLARARARSRFLRGAEEEDLLQEAMIGLYKAIRDYDAEKGASYSFAAFADMCVTRHLNTVIRDSQMQGNKVLNEYVSLYTPLFDEESMLLDVLCTQALSDNPEEAYMHDDRMNRIRIFIRETLTKLERDVLQLYLQGKNYETMAKELGRSEKCVDNALQRVKKKISAFLEIQ